jgi:hypothetical protein
MADEARPVGAAAAKPVFITYSFLYPAFGGACPLPRAGVGK